MSHDNNIGSNIAFFLVAAAIFIIGMICSVYLVGSPPTRATALERMNTVTDNGGFWALFHQGRRVRLAPASVSAEGGEVAGAESDAEAPVAAGEAAAAAPAPPSLDEVIAAINKGGCVACHTMPDDIPNAIGQVGPDLSNIGVDGATRREGYTAEEYIRESVKDPTAFAAPECPFGPCIPGTMPIIQLSDDEFEVIISYLAALGVN